MARTDGKPITPEIVKLFREQHSWWKGQDKANTTRYKLDWNAIRAIVLSRGYNTVNTFFYKNFGDKSICPARYPERMRWDRIGRVADALDVEPEVLIDEEYYFKKTDGLALYKIVCRGYKKGMSPADIIEATQFKKKDWMVPLFKCRITMEKCYVRVRALHRICEIVGLPIAALFRPFKNVTSSSVFGQIYSLVTTLSEEDLAILAGVAKLLQCEDNRYIEQEFEKLLALRDRLKGGVSDETSVGAEYTAEEL